MMANFADNLTRSRSYSFRGIAGRGTAMAAMVFDRNDIKCYIYDVSATSKVNPPSTSISSSRMMNVSRTRVKNTRTTHEGGRCPAWCSHNKTTTHSDADFRARRHKRRQRSRCCRRAFARQGSPQRRRTIFRQRRTSRNAPTVFIPTSTTRRRFMWPAIVPTTPLGQSTSR